MSGKKLDYKDIIEHWIRDPEISTLTVNEKGRHYYRVEVTSYVEAFSALFNTLKDQGHTLKEIQANSGGIVAALQQSLTPPKWEKLKEWRESIKGVWMFILSDAIVKENPISISKPDSGVVDRYKESRKQERQDKKETKSAPKPIAKKKPVSHNSYEADNSATSTVVERPEFDYSKSDIPKPTTVIEEGLLAGLLDEVEE